jgi:aminoglycoside phosphotransferase (APT) family kinase protein
MIEGVGRIAGPSLIDGAPLLATESACQMLREACAESSWRVLQVLEAGMVTEKPERRRTLRYRVVAGRVRGAGVGAVREVTWYAKQYRGSRGKRVFSLLRSLQSLAPDVLTPEPIGYSPKLRLLVMGALEGSTFSEALEDSAGIEAGVRRTGRALALIHKSETLRHADYLSAHGPREEIGVLEVARRLASNSPGFLGSAGAFMDLCSAVEEELAQVRQLGQAFLHRDFHPGQILFSRAGIGVLDWDDAALGEPELDLGNLEAHLFLDDLQRRGSIGAAPRLADALRAGYLALGDISFTHLATYRRAALLRLATLERLADPRVSVLDRESLARRLTEIVLSAT